MLDYEIDEKMQFWKKFLMFIFSIFLIVVNIWMSITLFKLHDSSPNSDYATLSILSLFVIFFSVILFFISIFWGNGKKLFVIDSNKIICNVKREKFVTAWSEITSIVFDENQIHIATNSEGTKTINLTKLQYSQGYGLVNSIRKIAQDKQVEIKG